MKRTSKTFRRIVKEQVRIYLNLKKANAPAVNDFQRVIAPVNAPRAVIFSPHPDDESIIGALPLRLLRQSNWKVVNVAVTLGSKRERQGARLRELKNACNYLGFNLVVAGMEKIGPETRKNDPARWSLAVKTIAEILTEQKPVIVFVPHSNDGHAAHVGTNCLVFDALKKLPKKYRCFVVETEYWAQMKQPNLLVESSVDDVADLVAAISFHKGEIRRNPYHARLPAWMMDNVRRGSELIAGHGNVPQDFIFGTIYRVGKWCGGYLQNGWQKGKFLGEKENPMKLFS